MSHNGFDLEEAENAIIPGYKEPQEVDQWSDRSLEGKDHD
jgi:hypothetical protein